MRTRILAGVRRTLPGCVPAAQLRRALREERIRLECTPSRQFRAALAWWDARIFRIARKNHGRRLRCETEGQR